MIPLLPAVPLLVVAAAYLAGARRLARRGDSWPRRRLGYALGGLAVLAVALLPPLAAHDEDPRIHVVQHLLLTVAGPLLLALGAPVTLALRSLRTPSRRRLLKLLHRTPVRALVHPGTVLALSAGGMPAVYLTGVFEAAEERPWLHAVLHAHMLLAGCVVAVVVTGVDPLPRPPGVVARLAVVVVAGAAHDVVAKVLYTRGWGPAAELLYSGGTAADVFLATAVLAGWYARGGRELARAARRSPYPRRIHDP